MAQWDPSLILLKFTLIKGGKDMLKHYVSVAITIVRSLKDFRIWIVLRVESLHGTKSVFRNLMLVWELTFRTSLLKSGSVLNVWGLIDFTI